MSVNGCTLEIVEDCITLQVIAGSALAAIYASAAATSASDAAGSASTAATSATAAAGSATAAADAAIVAHDASATAHPSIRNELIALYNAYVALDYDPGGTADAVTAAHDASGTAHSDIRSALSDHEADTDNPHGVTAAQAGADPAGSATAAQNAAIAAAASSLAGHNASPSSHAGTFEPALGNPGSDGYVLASTSGGIRSWVDRVSKAIANTWTALQTFSAGIKTSTIAPLADATNAIQITTAAGTPVITVDTTNKDVWLGTGVQYDETYKALFLNGTSAGYGITLPNNCAYSVTTSTGERVQVFRITGSNHIYVGPINWTASVSNTYINGNTAIHFRTRNAAATDYETSMTIHDQGGGVDFPFDIRVAGALSVGGNVDFSGLPTSDPGISGRLWNDGGTLKISAG